MGPASLLCGRWIPYPLVAGGPLPPPVSEEESSQTWYTETLKCLVYKFKTKLIWSSSSGPPGWLKAHLGTLEQCKFCINWSNFNTYRHGKGRKEKSFSPGCSSRSQCCHLTSLLVGSACFFLWIFSCFKIIFRVWNTFCMKWNFIFVNLWKQYSKWF